MLQGLICILLFVAIIILFIGYYLVFGHLVIVSFASVNGLSVVTNRYTLHNSSELLSVGLLLRPLAALGIVQASLTLLSFAQGVLRGATHKRRLQREGHSLLWVLRGETP